MLIESQAFILPREMARGYTFIKPFSEQNESSLGNKPDSSDVPVLPVHLMCAREELLLVKGDGDSLTTGSLRSG